MENNICRRFAIIFLLGLVGVNNYEASSVDPDSFWCHYNSNGSCITKFTVHFPTDIQGNLDLSIEYKITDNSTSRRVVDCDWINGNLTCLADDRYSYTTPVNGTFYVYVNKRDCVTGVTFSFIFKQGRTIACKLQQDSNCTSGNGSCTETTTPSKVTTVTTITSAITTHDVKKDSNVPTTWIVVGVVLAVVTIVVVVCYYYRHKLKNFCCRRNTETRPEQSAENEATARPDETRQSFLSIELDHTEPRE